MQHIFGAFHSVKLFVKLDAQALHNNKTLQYDAGITSNAAITSWNAEILGR